LTSFNVISDLHLEINKDIPIETYEFADADILCILGDLLPNKYLVISGNERVIKIHEKLKFLKDNVFPKYKKVYIILGNHDFYHGLYDDAEKNYKKFFADVPNLRVLQNEHDLFNDVVIVGCTLWTDFNKNNPLDSCAVQHGLADYHFIYRYYDENERGVKITPPFILTKFYESLAYLGFVCNEHADKDVVILTHHAPHLNCILPRYKGSSINAGFASDLSSFMELYQNVKLWGYGHTHSDVDFRCFETRIYSHQCGYQSYDLGQYENFKPDKVISL
jgi:predicted phosphodiesterase